ncbi:MAG: UDP-glucose/GDP-mannose dehydrogenase family protein [Bacteroides sp.]|nr:UDP-glucose/GDP-mannose dehydrogenase family protein [Bacteroides sp.]MCM1085030.1 UDP-glucose/GDP-mannose dehydrogenase family protein [Bacteroides sp.]MCM1169624.1 UDP-glucose/GDP-mannose dehydrogenase family protein [Bacteroides sp.]
MKITIVGTGYVGLVTGTCFAEMGTQVCCVDVDAGKVSMLQQGIPPIYEPGLEDMLRNNIQKGRITFTTSLREGIKDSEVVFTAVGTPPDEDGSADLKYVLGVAREVGQNMDHYMLVVTKSTVPVGTAGKVKAAIQEELDRRGAKIAYDVASNPEFLKEGSAIRDFMYPDRIVVGVESEQAKDVMARLYRPFTLNAHPVLFMDIPSAEMTKYAANSMLATRISFMNDIANLCELVGADVNSVREGIGSDSRIGNKFLYPGIGYGGSCFPKDVKALIRTAQKNGYQMQVLQAVESVNENQKSLLFRKFQARFGKDMKGMTVALWGLAFKPNTDDMREAPSLVLIDRLLKEGCKVRAYDPISMDECRRRIGDSITYCKDIYETIEGADVLFLVTEWTEFRNPDWDKVKNTLKYPVLFDGRNLYDKEHLKNSGFEYHGVGIL